MEMLAAARTAFAARQWADAHDGFLAARHEGPLDADEDELLLLAEKIPEPIRKRVLQRPDAFRMFAACDDETLDRLIFEIGQTPVNGPQAKKLPR